MDVNIIWLIPLGWLCGALVNYLSDVLPLHRSLSRPVCVHCSSKQPVINSVFWPRSCISCGKPRPRRVWVVEAVAILYTTWLWYYVDPQSDFWLYLLLSVYFGIVVVIDLEHHLILHRVSLVGVVIGLVAGWIMHGLKATLLGGVAGFLIMLMLYYFGVLLMKIIHRKPQVTTEEAGGIEENEALGFGDVTLTGVLGLILGWPGILAGLMVAILLGGAVALIYLIISALQRRYHAFSAIPYGPFLILGTLLLLLFNEQVLTLL